MEREREKDKERMIDTYLKYSFFHYRYDKNLHNVC